MAETLTYDNTPETEVLTADEQDSLEVGETLQAEQENLLAGKYKNAEELEKAYIELQGKLGSPKEEASEEKKEELEIEPEGEKEEEVEKPSSSDILYRLWDQAVSKDYKDDTLQELSNMSARDIAQMHLQYRADNQSQQEVITDEQVTQLKDIAGGDQGYNSMMGWAKDTLQKSEIDMYDAVMEKGDPLACFFAVQALKYRYDDASGVDGQMITGKAPSNRGDQFKSQAQVVEAMSDPKYDNDPAYRQDIIDKLDRSDLSF